MGLIRCIVGLLFVGGCVPIGDSALRARTAADAFLLGDPTQADTLVAAGDTAVIDDLLGRDLGAQDAAGYLSALALSEGVDTSHLVRTADTCDAYIEDSPTEFEIAERLVTTISPAPLANGTFPNCRMLTVAPECGPDALTDSVIMGQSTSALDVADYVDRLLRVDHPSVTAVRLMGTPTARVYRFAWVGNPDGPHNFNVYVCLPWQLTWHEAALRMSHEDP